MAVYFFSVFLNSFLYPLLTAIQLIRILIWCLVAVYHSKSGVSLLPVQGSIGVK
jgi:hypothetical protein